MSASTVFEVGSRMSIRRLCVRISNCSRESLSTCGQRITQDFPVTEASAAAGSAHHGRSRPLGRLQFDVVQSTYLMEQAVRAFSWLRL